MRSMCNTGQRMNIFFFFAMNTGMLTKSGAMGAMGAMGAGVVGATSSQSESLNSTILNSEELSMSGFSHEWVEDAGLRDTEKTVSHVLSLSLSARRRFAIASRRSRGPNTVQTDFDFLLHTS